jgi:hypothetical protein
MKVILIPHQIQIVLSVKIQPIILIEIPQNV